MSKLKWLEMADRQYHSYINRPNTHDSVAWYVIDIEPSQFIAFFELYDSNNEVIEQKEISFESWADAEKWCNNHASKIKDANYEWFAIVK